MRGRDASSAHRNGSGAGRGLPLSSARRSAMHASYNARFSWRREAADFPSVSSKPPEAELPMAPSTCRLPPGLEVGSPETCPTHITHPRPKTDTPRHPDSPAPSAVCRLHLASCICTRLHCLALWRRCALPPRRHPHLAGPWLHPLKYQCRWPQHRPSPSVGALSLSYLPAPSSQPQPPYSSCMASPPGPECTASLHL
eukprot:scaffold5708_cov107-Isochrysis_galbana.AAC.17